MKKIFIAVCVVLCGIVMTSCDNYPSENVAELVSLRLDYERKIKAYETCDTTAYDYKETRKGLLASADSARVRYLNSFSWLTDKERKEYKELEKELKSADKEYLGSIYDENTVNDDAKWHKLEATYSNVMK